MVRPSPPFSECPTSFLWRWCLSLDPRRQREENSLVTAMAMARATDMTTTTSTCPKMMWIWPFSHTPQHGYPVSLNSKVAINTVYNWTTNPTSPNIAETSSMHRIVFVHGSVPIARGTHRVPNSLTFEAKSIHWYIMTCSCTTRPLLVAYGMCPLRKLMKYYHLDPRQVQSHFIWETAAEVWGHGAWHTWSDVRNCQILDGHWRVATIGLFFLTSFFV
jgi:hypothetical protein